MAIKPRNLQKSSLLDLSGKPFRLAWLLPRTDRAEKTAEQKTVDAEGKTVKSVLTRMRETPGGFEGYAIRSKTPLARREWSAAEWTVLEIGDVKESVIRPTEHTRPAATESDAQHAAQ